MKKIALLSLVVLLAASGSAQTTTGSINGHEYVDLGLSVKWATCNVGASSPEGYGNYYAWGETCTKTTYTRSNSFSFAEDMDDIAGYSLCDAARANWGGAWRLPTKEEIDELISNCQHEWTILNGVNGYKVAGPNGNSIFIPAAGNRSNSSLQADGKNGLYWSSTPSEDDTFYADFIFFDSDGFFHGLCCREFGLPVRPVTE